SDQADRLAAADPERDIAQRPELLDLFLMPAAEERKKLHLQRSRRVVPQEKSLRDFSGFDDWHYVGRVFRPGSRSARSGIKSARQTDLRTSGAAQRRWRTRLWRTRSRTSTRA